MAQNHKIPKRASILTLLRTLIFTHNHYFDILAKVKRLACSILGPTFATSLETLPHSKKFVIRKCSTKRDTMISLSHSGGYSMQCLLRLHNFTVAISMGHKDIYINFFFLRTTRLWTLCLCIGFH